jgi:hypothetical protein
MVIRVLLCALFSAGLLSSATAPDPFTQTIRPILAANCMPCHDPKAANPAKFLTAQTAKDIEAKRGLWRNVAAQLRNRSMPPIASKITEEERLVVANWVENRLRETACSVGEFAGAGTLRRLNRREYHNTIRDLLGVDFTVAALLPADGTGGAGFDTNGETLYTGPLLTERYLEAARQILDHAIITPPLVKTFTGAELSPTKLDIKPGRPVAAGDELSASVLMFTEGNYELRATIEPVDPPPALQIKLDGVAAGSMTFPPRGPGRSRPVGGALVGRRGPVTLTASLTVHLERGVHAITVATGGPATLNDLTVEQKPEEPSAERRALHFRLLGTEPGMEPLQARKAAQRILNGFLPRAYRRPVKPAEGDRFLTLYDRAAERGDPYEERIKLMLKGVLVSPDFLFKIEARHDKPGIYPLGQYEMANRLSYFFWSTMPDDELMRLAEQGRLQDPKVLTEQMDRMLDDPRSDAFTTSFIGQWLGTQDLGERLVPFINTVADFYNLESAADLRREPVLLYNRILGENRSLLELLTADYTYLTPRLVKYYQLEGKVQLHGNGFELVKWPDNRRAGVLGMAAPLAITGQLKNTNPVLRGAWVLEVLLGTPVPPPPPNVPRLPEGDAKGEEPTMREKLSQHRSSPACFTCHRGTAASPDAKEGRLPAASYRKDSRLRAGAQFAGWR